jgi:hypothetical protein
MTFVFSTPERHWETKPLMKMGDFDVCNKKNPMNITIKGKMQQSLHLNKHVKMNGIFANYL